MAAPSLLWNTQQKVSIYQFMQSRASTPTLTTREVRGYLPLGRPLRCTVHGRTLATVEHAAGSLNISVHAFTSTHSHPHDTRCQRLLTLRKATTVHPRCTVHRCTLTACGTRRKFLEALTGQSPSTALSRVCEERLLPQAENWPGTPGWGPITALSLPPQPMGMRGGGPMGARALVETL